MEDLLPNSEKEARKKGYSIESSVLANARGGGYAVPNTPAAADQIARNLQARRKAQDKGKVKTGSNNQTETKSFKQGVQDAGQKGLEEGGGGAMDTAGSALMMSGNPYAMAAGGAMKVIGQVKAKREAQAQKRANDENNRRKNLQEALSNLGSGIGSIGMA
jgi:hypothetical protein